MGLVQSDRLLADGTVNEGRGVLPLAFCLLPCHRLREYRLVDHPLAVRTDRHQENIVRAQLVVRDLVDTLRQRGSGGIVRNARENGVRRRDVSDGARLGPPPSARASISSASSS